MLTVSASDDAARPQINRLPTRGNGHPATTDVVYEADELEFMRAIEAFKSSSGRKFPTWKDVFAVVKSLGYQRDPEDNQGDGDAPLTIDGMVRMFGSLGRDE